MSATFVGFVATFWGALAVGVAATVAAIYGLLKVKSVRDAVVKKLSA